MPNYEEPSVYWPHLTKKQMIDNNNLNPLAKELITKYPELSASDIDYITNVHVMTGEKEGMEELAKCLTMKK